MRRICRDIIQFIPYRHKPTSATGINQFIHSCISLPTSRAPLCGLEFHPQTLPCTSSSHSLAVLQRDITVSSYAVANVHARVLVLLTSGSVKRVVAGSLCRCVARACVVLTVCLELV